MGDAPASARSRAAPNTQSSMFATPQAVKQLFSKFPLRTYPANELPFRARRQEEDNILHVFSSESGARMDSPSFNPGCLKWQTYLKFLDIPFRAVSSSNHASPTGSLPFLLPVKSSSAVSSSKLDSWAREKYARGKDLPVQHQLYASLLSQPVRLAYLHALYLDNEAFKAVAAPLYIHPSSRHSLIRASLGPPLRAAALDQLLASSFSNDPTTKVDLEVLYKDAEEAFESLDDLLEGHQWYSQTNGSAIEEQKPGMLDASVFAYTHVILTLFASLSTNAPGARLRSSLTKCGNLLDHHNRIAREYYHAPR